MTTKQRFETANTTGDGRLTLDQAKAGYPSIARHFQEIDADRKGFVTLDDIKAWRKAAREARRQARQSADDPLRPRNAYQRNFSDPRPTTTTPVIGPQRQAGSQPPAAWPPPTDTAQATPVTPPDP
jgi:hypothetical protein